ncbi:MAG: PKD domain-containing protein [Oligoflexales bacterium]|nr:PKD domain-containing protein [Oligoflexales bacterium]
MITQKILILISAFVISTGLICSCGPAEYELVKKNKSEAPKEIAPPPASQYKFGIEGPTRGYVGTPVQYTGKNCGINEEGRISWTVPELPDQGKKTGKTVSYTFDTAKVYTIQATCEVDGQPTQTDSIRVLITDDPNKPKPGQNGSNTQSVPI